MAKDEPVPQTREESEKRVESSAEPKHQEGSKPKETGERNEAPKQEKAAADPNE